MPVENISAVRCDRCSVPTTIKDWVVKNRRTIANVALITGIAATIIGAGLVVGGLMSGAALTRPVHHLAANSCGGPLLLEVKLAVWVITGIGKLVFGGCVAAGLGVALSLAGRVFGE